MFFYSFRSVHLPSLVTVVPRPSYAPSERRLAICCLNDRCLISFASFRRFLKTSGSDSEQLFQRILEKIILQRMTASCNIGISFGSCSEAAHVWEVSRCCGLNLCGKPPRVNPTKVRTEQCSRLKITNHAWSAHAFNPLVYLLRQHKIAKA